MQAHEQAKVSIGSLALPALELGECIGEMSRRGRVHPFAVPARILKSCLHAVPLGMPRASQRERGSGRPGLLPPAAGATRRAQGAGAGLGAIARREERPGLKASRLRAAVGGVR